MHGMGLSGEFLTIGFDAILDCIGQIKYHYQYVHCFAFGHMVTMTAIH